MVAYSFKKQFVDPIRRGLGQPEKISVVKFLYVQPKLQTIRVQGKRRHARAGEELQLYCGQRTKHCFLIGKARCIETLSISITFHTDQKIIVGAVEKGREGALRYSGDALNDFARRDGFADWPAMQDFWHKEHGDVGVFIGKIIFWRPL
jgi:hypothetical protein